MHRAILIVVAVVGGIFAFGIAGAVGRTLGSMLIVPGVVGLAAWYFLKKFKPSGEAWRWACSVQMGQVAWMIIGVLSGKSPGTTFIFETIVYAALLAILIAKNPKFIVYLLCGYHTFALFVYVYQFQNGLSEFELKVLLTHFLLRVISLSALLYIVWNGWRTGPETMATIDVGALPKTSASDLGAENITPGPTMKDLDSSKNFSVRTDETRVSATNPAKSRTDAIPQSREMPREIEDGFYEEALGELENDCKNAADWSRAFSESDGDLNRAKASYIKARVVKFRDEYIQSEKLKIETERQEELNKKRLKRAEIDRHQKEIRIKSLQNLLGELRAKENPDSLTKEQIASALKQLRELGAGE